MREDGYYFVRIKEFGWCIGEYHKSTNEFFLCGTECEFTNDDIEEINECRIKMPNEEQK